MLIKSHYPWRVLYDRPFTHPPIDSNNFVHHILPQYSIDYLFLGDTLDFLRTNRKSAPLNIGIHMVIHM